MAPNASSWAYDVLNGISPTLINNPDALTPNVGCLLWGMDPVVAANIALLDAAVGSGGTTVKINGSTVTNPNFNHATPAALSGFANITWRVSGSNVSAYSDLTAVPNQSFGDGSGQQLMFQTGTLTTVLSGSAVSIGASSDAVINGGDSTIQIGPSGSGVQVNSGSGTFEVTDGLGSVWVAATGGSQGSGTINATGLFVNGVSVGPLVASKTFYVDGTRTDSYTANGTIQYPFKTIMAAVNQVITNADNSTNQYVIKVQPATYAETIDLGSTALYNLTLDGGGFGNPAYAAFGNTLPGAVVNPSSGNALQGLSNLTNLTALTVNGFTLSKPVNFTDSGNTFGSLGFTLSNCAINANVTLSAGNSGVMNVSFISTAIKPTHTLSCTNTSINWINSDMNAGTFNLTSAGGQTAVMELVSWAFNPGQCNINAGSFIVAQDGVNLGGVTVTVNGTLILDNAIVLANVVVNSGGTFQNNMGSVVGSITVNAGGTHTVAGNNSIFESDFVNAGTGFRVNNGATSGNYLRGNGTNFVSSAIQAGDVNTLIKWSDLQNATAALTLANAGNATTFNQTSAVNWTWANTTAATSGTSQSSPILNLNGTYWTGAASAANSWTIQNVIANGTNGATTLSITQSGTSGTAKINVPATVGVYGWAGGTGGIGPGGGGNTNQVGIVSGGSEIFRVTGSGLTSAGGDLAIGAATLGLAATATRFGVLSASGNTQLQTLVAATSGGVTVTYGSNSSATTSTTISLTIAVGDAVLVVANGNGAVAPTIADNGTAGGNTYTNQSTNAPYRLFTLFTATKTATVITVSVSSGTISAAAVVFHGGTFSLGHVGSLGANAGATAASALSPASATSQILLFGVASSAASAESVSAGYTIQTSAGPNSGSSISYSAIAAWNTSVAPFQVISGTFTATSSTLTQALAVEVVGGLGANSQSSPTFTLIGNYWNGASANDTWVLQNTPVNATSGEPILLLTHSGSSGPSTFECDNISHLLYTTAVATVSTTNTSPSLVLGANYWDGTISGMDAWMLSTSLAAGSNGISQLNVTHSGSTGAASVKVPALQFSAVTANSGVLFGFGGSGTNNAAVSLNVTGGSQACMSWGLNGTIGLNCLTGFTGASDAGIYFSTYLGNTTAGAGIPSIFAKSNLTTQSAAITATTILAVPNTASRTRSGLYRVAYSASITTAGTTSTLGGTNGFQVIYTNVNDSVVKTSPAGPNSTANTTGTMISGEVIVYAKAGTNIQYTFGYTSSGTAMVYDLNIYVEFLG